LQGIRDEAALPCRTRGIGAAKICEYPGQDKKTVCAAKGDAKGDANCDQGQLCRQHAPVVGLDQRLHGWRDLQSLEDAGEDDTDQTAVAVEDSSETQRATSERSALVAADFGRRNARLGRLYLLESKPWFELELPPGMKACAELPGARRARAGAGAASSLRDALTLGHPATADSMRLPFYSLVRPVIRGVWPATSSCR
jgi:hypothetical protein